MTNEIAHLPHVRRVESILYLNAAPLGPDGAAVLSTVSRMVTVGSIDGLLFGQDRVAVIHGRMADPGRVDEVMMTADAARILGLHVGQVVPMGLYTDAQTSLPRFGTPSVPPYLRVDAKLVGIAVFNNQVVQDDVDRSAEVVFTAAATAPLLESTGFRVYGLRLDRGTDIPAVEQAFVRLLPPGSTYNFHVTSRIEAQVERAVKPEATALGVFGAIAALAALFIAVQAISRQLRSGDDELQVLRALGAGPAITVSDGMGGVLGAVVLGSLLAGGIAVGLSPLAPLGPARSVYPAPGIDLDWTVLGLGILVLVAGLAAVAVLLAYLGAPHRIARRSRLVAARSSKVVGMAASSGLPPPAVVGVRFALESGRGRTAVPVRSALVGTAIASVMVAATPTFGSGLRNLVSHPPLYGWNWTYALTNPVNQVPPQALALLDHVPTVAAWAGINEANAQIDGQNVPILLGSPRLEPAPPVLSGHGLASDDQIVVGAATLARLREHVGDTVVVTYGAPQDAPLYVPPTRLVIVGTATMPAVGFSGFIADHTSMGTGALISTGIEPAALQRALLNPDPNLNGPKMVLVRLRNGVSPAAGRADMQRIADAANKALAADPNTSGTSVVVLGVQHPAEIVNYRSVGATPVILASGLAAGAIAALGLTLAASVRRRRRDLALLKALGFTGRQLAATVAWHASVAAVIGIVVGVPLGIALGRQLWILFARNINAVPYPTVPMFSVTLVAVGALLFANLVAALPGRSAARTPTALVLRTE